MSFTLVFCFRGYYVSVYFIAVVGLRFANIITTRSCFKKKFKSFILLNSINPFPNKPFDSSPEHKVLRVKFCDHSLSFGVRRPFTLPCLHSSIYKY